jgi:acyl-CoA dehydrogenase
VAGYAPRARPTGDRYVVNGGKTFITSGARADFVTTAVRTGGDGYGGVTLLVVDTDSPGSRSPGRLDKLGWHCSDTAECPCGRRGAGGNLVGGEGQGSARSCATSPASGLSMAVQACATAQRCLRPDHRWCHQRSTFGAPLATRQVVRHRIAEMARTTAVARTYVWSLAQRVADGEKISPVEVAMAKNTAVAACDQVVDAAVQLHGGAGYLRDSEVERHYRDARIMGIGGGTTEIMNEIIAKGLLDARTA